MMRSRRYLPQRLSSERLSWEETAISDSRFYFDHLYSFKCTFKRVPVSRNRGSRGTKRKEKKQLSPELLTMRKYIFFIVDYLRDRESRALIKGVSNMEMIASVAINYYSRPRPAHFSADRPYAPVCARHVEGVKKKRDRWAGPPRG